METREVVKKLIRAYWKYSEKLMVNSLLETLRSINLNLLLDVGFNREVAEDVALYFSKEEGNLAGLFNQAEVMSEKQIADMGRKQKNV